MKSPWGKFSNVNLMLVVSLFISCVCFNWELSFLYDLLEKFFSLEITKYKVPSAFLFALEILTVVVKANNKFALKINNKRSVSFFNIC
jgi:hypothetical protein